MYKMIGADGREYGPVTAEVLRQWLAEGRVNGQTRVLPEGGTVWVELSTLAAFFPPPSATPSPFAPAPPATAAQDVVQGPAVGLMVAGGLALLGHCWGLFGHLVSRTWRFNQPVFNQPVFPWRGQMGHWTSLTQGVGLPSLGLVVAAFVLLGGIQMRRLENYGLVMAASVVAMLPCSCCCLVGLPVGIWALVVLSKPEVRAAFR